MNENNGDCVNGPILFSTKTSMHFNWEMNALAINGTGTIG